jgi:hypothetical protein
VADARIREAERRWRADPTDQAALEAAIQERRRAGAPVPTPLLDARLFPAKKVGASVPMIVEVERPTGEVELAGATSGRLVKLPTHRAWWVCPAREGWRSYGKLEGADDVPHLDELGEDGLARALAEVRERKLPGVAIRARAVPAATLRGLGDALVNLDLHRSTLPDGLGSLAELPRLQRLDLSGEETLPPDALPPLPELVTLRLDFLRLERPLALPPSVVRLGLQSVEGPEQVTPWLASLEQLTHLVLRGTRLSTATIGHVADCKGITSLDLESTNVGDDQLERVVKALPGLVELNLTRCDELGDAGLAALAGLPALRRLHVDHCRGFTSAGVERLAPLGTLETLYLRGSKGRVAELRPGRDALRSALPGCKIY